MEHQQTQRDLQKTDRQEQEQQFHQRRQNESIDRTLLAQAILAGTELGDLPRRSLEDLAQQVGNSGMIALSGMYDLQPSVKAMPDIRDSAAAEAFPVPDGLTCQRMAAPSLTGSWPAAAANPAMLDG